MDLAIDKAVILARGLGKRMRKSNDSVELDSDQAAMAEMGLKALMPTGRPFVDYVLAALADAGYKRICMVVGPEHDVMRKHLAEQLKPKRVSVEFAIQPEPLGTADAVAAAEQFAGSEEFLCINSDNYYPVEALKALRELDSPGLAAFEYEGMLAGSNIPAERIFQFAVVKIDQDGYMERVLEKPDEQTIASLPNPICLSMNCWRFDSKIFPACRAIEPSPRGELEIPDAVQYTIDQFSSCYRALTFSAPVLDLSSRTDIPAVMQKLAGTEVKL